MKYIKKPSSGSPSGKTGSILIYVLWLSALLGLFTLSIGYTARQKLKMVERIDSRRSLRLAAESAVQRGLWAIHQGMDNNTIKVDALNSAWSQNDEIFKGIQHQQTVVSVVKSALIQKDDEMQHGLTDEESKINVNGIKDAGILKRLVQLIAGLTDEESSVIADSILDWIDSDDHVNASGAENLYYQGLKRPLVPKNGPLDVLEELLYVRGMTPDIYVELSKKMTIFGDGKVNLNTASQTVLLALGLDQTVVDFIAAYRAGSDGMVGTKDDGIFNDPNSLVELAVSSGGVAESERNALENLLSRGLLKTTSDCFEVISVATQSSGHERLTARVVISREHGILSWSEFNTHHA